MIRVKSVLMAAGVRSAVRRLVVVCAFFGLLSAYATDGTWNWSSTATPDGRSAENAADWNTAANWLNKTPPSGSTATAWLVPQSQTTPISGEGARYIRVPDAGIDLGEINVRQSATIFVTGGPIRFGTSSSQSANAPRIRDEGATCNAYYYSLLDFTKKGTTFNRAFFCGPIKWHATAFLAHSSTLFFYGNAWATNALTAVTDPFPYTVYSPGSGTPRYVARMGAAAQSCAWKTFKGSPFLRRVGARHDLAAGATVSGDNIPPGAFVTRIYTSDAIEISAPCTDDSGDEGVTVDFDAFTPAVTVQHIKRVTNQAGGKSPAYMMTHAFAKIRDEDVFDVYLDEVAEYVTLGLCTDARVFTASGTYSAKSPRLFVKSAPDKGAFQVQSVNLIFSPANGTSFTVNDILLGHNNNTTDQDYCPVLESPAGVTTTIASVRNLRYAVTTRGAGTFDMASTNSHHNTLVVQDGTTVFRAKRPELNPDFTTITVKDGAAFRLAEGKVSVTTFAAESGATIVADAGTTLVLSGLTTCSGVTFGGAGTIRLPNVTSCAGATFDVTGTVELPALTSGADATFKGPCTYVLPSASSVAGATYAGTPVFRFTNCGTARDVIVDEPVTPEVVGDPAFWVDAAQNTTKFSFEWTDKDNVTKTYTGVSRWLDCRATAGSDAYTTYYGTNDWTGIGTSTQRHVAGRPGTLQVGTKNLPYIQFDGISYPGSSNYRNTWSGMVWNRPITNVCAVFSVYVRNSGGQAALGCTTRFAEMGTARTANDFMRGVNGPTSGGGVGTPGNYVLDSSSADCVKNGWIFVNGVRKAWTDSVPSTYDFAVVEYHPIAPRGRADAFAIQQHNNAETCSGCQKLAETIVYTNELTMAERRRVCAYLMQKYGMGVQTYEISDNRFIDYADVNALANGSSFGLDVPEDAHEGLTQLDAGATFVKSGAGQAYVDYVNGGSLDVRGGTLEVQSKDLTDEVVPAGYFVHLDAFDTNRMTIVDKVYPDSVTRKMVHNWRPKNPADPISAQKRTSDSRYTAPWLAYPAALGGKPVLDFGELHDGRTDYQGCFLDYITEETVDGQQMHYATANYAGSLFAMIGSKNGGGLPFAFFDYAPWRDVTDDPSVPFFNGTAPSRLRETNAGRINGEKVTLSESGLDGTYQVVSVRPSSAQYGRVRSINAAGSRQYLGGGELGEILIYTNTLDAIAHQLVDRYLNWKWLGIGYAGYRPSLAGAVSVAEGAVLKVSGGAPLTVASLSGAGTVSGSVKLSASAAFLVTVKEDGSIDPLTVGGDLDLSAGTVVTVTGAVGKLKSGVYPIVTAASVTAGPCSCAAVGAKRSLTVRCGATSLDLVVTSPGCLIFVR